METSQPLGVPPFVKMDPDKAADMWCEQSKLLWSRIKTASVIEAATLVAAYTLWRNNNSLLSCAILIVSCMLLFRVMKLMKRDQQYLKVFQELAKFDRPEGESGTKIGTEAIWILIIFNLLSILYLVWPCIHSCHCANSN
jgi:hypothetical protein